MSGNETTLPPKADHPPKDQASAPPANDAAAELAAYKKRVADYEARESARKADEAKALEDQKKKAKEDGDLKAQLDLQNKEIERLKALEADAAEGKAYRERETKRIDDAKVKLSEADRALIDAQPSLALRAQLLDRLTAAASQAPVKAGQNGLGAPPVGSVDFDKAANETELQRLIKQHPKEWEAHKAALRGASSKQPTIHERSKPRLVSKAS